MRSSKSTWWPSKSGPSTQANLICSPILTRHPPHIPVPSTITGFRLTMVRMPCGRVASAHPFIIGQPFRLRAFRDAVRHIVDHRDRLWITTPGEIARYCESLPKGTVPGSE